MLLQRSWLSRTHQRDSPAALHQCLLQGGGRWLCVRVCVHVLVGGRKLTGAHNVQAAFQAAVFIAPLPHSWHINSHSVIESWYRGNWKKSLIIFPVSTYTVQCGKNTRLRGAWLFIHYHRRQVKEDRRHPFGSSFGLCVLRWNSTVPHKSQLQTCLHYFLMGVAMDTGSYKRTIALYLISAENVINIGTR